MIKPLRTFHFFLWRIVALVIPVLFALAVIFRPTSSERDHLPEDFSWRTEHDSDSTLNILVSVKSPLRVPSCLLYGEGERGRILLGQLDSMGDYKFNAPTTITQLLLFDEIHQKEITSKQINP